ncbi:MAG: EAL domain-containing protein [Chloroflexota bacterium]
MVSAHERRTNAPKHTADTDRLTRADALRRFAAEVSGRQDLDGLFRDVIDESFTLFGVDEAGLWMYDDSATPLQLAAQRGLSPDVLEVIATLPRDAPTTGMEAMRRHEVRIMRGDLSGTLPAVQVKYERAGIRTVCFVPIVFHDEPLGLLTLYHHSDYAWTDDETELVRAFADHMATAISNARLANSTRTLAARLRVIAELAARLSRLQDVPGIAHTIVAETRQLIDYDTIRVYRVDTDTGWCEPIAFQGDGGATDRDGRPLRVRVGEGLTGWVAEHGQAIRLADAGQDPRAITPESSGAPASALLVPMIYEQTVHGVLVVSKDGLDQFDADDETTLAIFAGYAAHAIVNATSMQKLQRQQIELEHQLEGQRRLLEVNERLLSTLEPAGVLDLIADSLKAIVPYDSLTVYRADREAGVRRAVIARDRFAELILAHESPLGIGISGWVIDHGEAVCANQAHLDPRSVQVPGTPFEPEAMIVVPLLVDGLPIGTLNIGRMGEAEAAFSPNEFELTQLFAGQASIALQNAEIHGAVRIRADQDALTGLRNHGSFQRELGDAVAGGGRPFSILMLDMDAFKAFNDACGHPAGDSLLAAIAHAMTGATRDGDRLYRYGGDEFAAILPGADRNAAHDVAERIRRAVVDLSTKTGGPTVTISVGVACYPDDGLTKDALVGVADRAMYLAKPTGRAGRVPESQVDPYLRALDETALALLDRHGGDDLLETIMTRATALLGTPHGFLYLVEPGQDALVVRRGTGVYAGCVGYRLPIDRGLGGQVYRTGAPLAIDDYDTWSERAPDLPKGTFGSVFGVPLTTAGRVVGVLGLSSGASDRRWGTREIDSLTSFAQLASIALDNARLVDEAQRGAMYDLTTGLPNRELLTDRIAHALASSRPDGPGMVGVILMDLDRFKVINESVGHNVGDRLLVSVGQRLIACLRPGDTVARFGGDEFGILLEEVAGIEEAHRIADRIDAELRAPFSMGDREWFISASIGISLGRGGRATPEEMLREAEVAMVQAKSDPARRHALFEPSMSRQTLERIDLENDLRRGIERGELRLHYQPLIDLATDRIVGFEALVRWEHPVRGLMPPLLFVPLAEETGLILPLGRWVLEVACRQAQAWRNARPDAPPLFMSVNLSARQFAQPGLVDQVQEILAETGLDPACLEIEITESVLMDQSETGIRTLRQLRELGVHLVLDDFGTGYSSLSYLKHLSLDTIKIDRTFVAGLEGDTDRSIVDAVIALAHGLRIGTVAEGIETEFQLEQLREMGCDLGQGYLFARPLPAVEAGRLLTGRRVGRATRAVASAQAGRGQGVGPVRAATRRTPRSTPATARPRTTPKAVA